MPKVIATHEVDDVAHWLSSPKRAEVFGDLVSDLVTYVDAQNPKRVGLSMTVHDMAAFQAMLESPAGADAMKVDGVHPDTLSLLIQS
jgi:hypothetical protein